MPTGLNTSFEKEVCGRCGGCGTYSYNQVDGSRCYGCGGKGERLTKRGAAAAAYLRDLLTVSASGVRLGDRLCVYHMSGGSYYAPVTEIAMESESRGYSVVDGVRKDHPPRLHLRTEHPRFGKSGLSTFPDSPVRVKPDAEQHRKLIEQAVAHQATLTKAGKPRKRKAA